MLIKILLLILFLLNLFAIILATDSRIKHGIMKYLYVIQDSMSENTIIGFPFTIIHIISEFIYHIPLIGFGLVKLLIYALESIISRL